MAADEFLKVQQQLDQAARPRPKHPTGWEPGVDTAAGVLIVEGGAEPPQDWADIIRELGLDPAVWTVDESQPVQVRTWDSGDRRCYYYRAAVRPAAAVAQPDVLELIREVKRRRPKTPPPSDADRALLVCLSDWQVGKGDYGGPEALVERILRLKDAVPARLAELKKAGRPVSRLIVAAMGDLVEGCDGHYAQQTYSVALDRRRQVTLVRRLLVELLTAWAPLAPEIVVTCVPGNHGENRRDGKSFTSFEDNDDLAVVEQAAEVLAANPEAYGHIRFGIPDGDMTVTLEVYGTVVAFAHGHQARAGSGGPQGKLARWWRDKAAARHPVGDADILISGHYHHLQVVEDGPRTWLQCPANDGGSRWYEEQGGPTTACGTLTLTVSSAGWADLQVLR